MPASAALFIFPLTAAVLYAVSALVLKRSSDLGVGVWRTTFVANLIVAACYSALWLLGGKPIQPALLWQPALIALCLFGGQLTQFVALDRGDVSVAVPIFGLKVIIVAFVTPLLIGVGVAPAMWVAALLSVAGVTFLNKKEGGVAPRGIGITLLAGGCGSVCFAMFDVLVQKWGPQWGAGRLLPCVFWINAVLSLGLALKFSAPLSAVKKAAWPWLLMGSLLLGVQSILFVSFLAIHGSATAANIVYSARGLLSVLMVWSVGHWFSNTERNLGAKVLRWRLAGAVMMLAAIVIVVTNR